MSGTAVAQAGRVEGVVRTATGDPVQGAQVTVVETNTVVATDKSGRYVIDGVPVGFYTIRFNSIGFQIVTLTDQQVTAGAATTANATMEPSILRIEGVVVTGVNDLSSALASGQTLDLDATLDDLDQVYLVFKTHFDLAQFAEAQRWCTEGGRHAPDDHRFTLCQLWMMTTPTRDPDVDGAWQLATQVGQVAPAGLREYSVHEASMIVGGVIARAGMADSANTVLNGARAAGAVDPSRSLLRIEAFMRTLAGQNDAAIDLLAEFRRANPDYSFEFEGELRWYWEALRNHPGFEAIRERG